jgi:hypothetical protein
MDRKRRALPAVLAALVPLALSAQTLHLGSEFPVNTYTTSAEVSPAAAASSDGGFVVVWQNFTQDGGGLGIYGQRFDGVGAKAGAEFPVNSYATGAQVSPAVATDSHGNFVVVWESDGQDGSFFGIYGQRYDAAGVKLGGEFRVNTTTALDQQAPAIAMAPDGRFVVVWCGGYGPDSDVWGQRFDSGGGKVGGEFRVNTYTPEAQNAPAVAADGAGNFVVVWMSEVGGIFSREVLGQRFDAAGVKVGSDFRVNTYTSGEQGYPAIATDRAGNFVVAWQSVGQDGDSTGIFGQRFNNGAEKVGAEVAVNEYTTSAQGEVSIALEPDGGFDAVWRSFHEDGNDYAIAARRFDRTGAPREHEFLWNVATAGAQLEPAIVATLSGMLAVWAGPDGDSYGIWGRRQNLVPRGLGGDDHGIGTSDLNGVIEPGEAVRIEPRWGNRDAGPAALEGTVGVSDFGGPPGPTYALFDGVANYGTIGAGADAGCDDGNASPCYAVQVFGTRPATHWDATLTEHLSLGGSHPWTLHIGESFADVPKSQPFYAKIETLLHHGVTSGCTATEYCPDTAVSRGQMAIFIAKGIAGAGELVPKTGFVGGQPYDCSKGGVSRFSDVAPLDPFCRHVHYLGAQNVTLGCGPGLYCPGGSVTRDAMASFIAKAIVAPGGGGAVPLIYTDSATGRSYSCAAGSPNVHFSDVPISNPFCRHVHYLWAKGIVSGCSATQYCPAAPVARDAMAKFLANGFGLALYGP